MNTDMVSNAHSPSTFDLQAPSDQEPPSPQPSKALQEKIGTCSTARVVGIGAGPVGLMALYNLKCLCPHLDIVAIDKREAYTRAHGLFLSKQCFKNSVSDPDLDQLIQRFYTEIDRGRTIPSLDIETNLKALCEKKGVRFLRGIEFDHNELKETAQKSSQELQQSSSAPTIMKIQGLSQLKALFPKADVIIGADGAHSEVRKALYGDELQHSKVLQHTVFVRYSIAKPAKKLDIMTHGYKAMNTTKRIVIEHTSSQSKDGKYEVVLHMFVPEEEYKTLASSSSWKKPKAIESEDIHPNLKSCIKTWLNTRHLATQEKPENITAVAVPLTTYASPSFVKVIEEGPICTLVGDAAFGVPFNKSCANGIRCAIKLSRMIHEHFETVTSDQENSSRTISQTLKAYDQFVGRFALDKIKEATVTSLGIEVGNLCVQLLSQVKLPFTALTKDEEEKVQKGPHPTQLPVYANIFESMNRAWVKVVELAQVFFIWKRPGSQRI